MSKKEKNEINNAVTHAPITIKNEEELFELLFGSKEEFHKEYLKVEKEKKQRPS